MFVCHSSPKLYLLKQAVVHNLLKISEPIKNSKIFNFYTFKRILNFFYNFNCFPKVFHFPAISSLRIILIETSIYMKFFHFLVNFLDTGFTQMTNGLKSLVLTCDITIKGTKLIHNYSTVVMVLVVLKFVGQTR